MEEEKNNLEEHYSKFEQNNPKKEKNIVWTENIEKAVRDIGASCREYKYINMEAARTCTIKYDVLMYIMIIIGPLSGIFASADLSAGTCSISSPLQILVAIFSFASGVLTAVIKFSKLENKIIAHKSISVKFGSLENNIQRQLALEREDRQDAARYFYWVSHCFEELFNSSPIIIDSVYEKWLQERIKQGEVEAPLSIQSQQKQVPVVVQPEETDKNIFSDGNMRYELDRLRRN
jgi:hypothetical protein